LKRIADYTNLYKSQASSTCDKAIDYLVFRQSDCPSDANFLEDVEVFNAQMLIGKKCCILFPAYTVEFFNARYASNSFPCSRARSNIQEYFAFNDKLESPTLGLPVLATSLLDLEQALLQAAYSLNTYVNIRNLARYTEDYLPSAFSFQHRLNCSSLQQIYHKILEQMCTQSSPISSQILGALVFAQIMAFISFCVFSGFILPVDPSDSDFDDDSDHEGRKEAMLSSDEEDNEASHYKTEKGQDYEDAVLSKIEQLIG